MPATSSALANTSHTSQSLRRSPRTSKRDFEPQVIANLKPKNVSKSSNQKRKGVNINWSQNGIERKSKNKSSFTTEQDHIRFLEEENKALKIESEALKQKLSKKHTCPICNRLYSRSDNLYTHLRNGDMRHKNLAQKRYRTKCETCGKQCKRWGDLRKHMAKHGQEVSEFPDDLNSASNPIASAALNSSTTQENLSSETSLAVNEGSVQDMTCHLHMSTSFTSEGTTSCTTSTPYLEQAPGFSNNPARGLEFSTPSHIHPFYGNDSVTIQASSFLNNPARELDFATSSHVYPPAYDYDTVTIQAPGFSNNPVRELDFANSSHAYPSVYNCDTVTIQAPGFSDNPARELDFSTPCHIQPFYSNNSVTIQAPGFSNNPARELDFATSSRTDPSVYDYDTVTMQAPAFSNSQAHEQDFSTSRYPHPSPHKDTVIVQTPGFSNSPSRGLDFASSDNPCPPLYSTVDLGSPSLWPFPFIARPNSAPINKMDGRLNYTATCGSHHPADPQGPIQSIGNIRLPRLF